MTGVGIILSTSPLIGMQLASNPALATIPMSLQYFATMVSFIPASQFALRYGRRSVFLIGAFSGGAGGAMALAGILNSSFFLFALSGIMIGIYSGTGQAYRFAAAEMAEEQYRSRTMSWILSGGIVAAFLGPMIVRWTSNVWQTPFSLTYGLLLVMPLMAVALIFRVPWNTPVQAQSSSKVTLLKILSFSDWWKITCLSALSYGAMNFLMLSSPLAMQFCGFNFAETSQVIQWHILMMYAPSLIVGQLVRRIGERFVMVIGFSFYVLAWIFSTTGISYTHFLVALIFLGVGWNFLYATSSFMLVSALGVNDRVLGQGLHDTLVFGVTTASSFLVAPIFLHTGWILVNAIFLVATMAIGVLICFLPKSLVK